jgi:hypothetical protein
MCLNDDKGIEEFAYHLIDLEIQAILIASIQRNADFSDQLFSKVINKFSLFRLMPPQEASIVHS